MTSDGILPPYSYDALTFEGPHVSPGVFDREHRVLSVFSFSKTYAMTGVRVGYLAAPELVADTSAKLQGPMIACVNAPAQAAALAALVGPQEPVVAMRNTYNERRVAAMSALDRYGLSYLRPPGSVLLVAGG